MSKKHKEVCMVLNYIEHLLILVSTDNVFVSISAFASLVAILIGIINPSARLKISVIIAGIKM